MNAKTLQSLIRQNAHYVLTNTSGLTQEESLQPMPGDANPFNWIVGHLCFWRNSILSMAGLTPVWAEGEGAQYRGSPEQRQPLEFDSDHALDIGLLARDFQTMQERLEAISRTVDRQARSGGRGVRELPAREEWSRMEAELPGHFLNLLLHEAYHAGQLGILRRALGKEGVI